MLDLWLAQGLIRMQPLDQRLVDELQVRLQS